MDAMQKNIASVRGEALAANLLASAALQAVFVIVPNRDEFHKRISNFIDDTLNISGPAKGDANDEFNTMVREVARHQAMQTLDAIERMIRDIPKK